MIGKGLMKRVLIGTECDVTHKQSVALRASLVTEALGTGLSTVFSGARGSACVRKIDIHLTSVKLDVVLFGVSFRRVGSIGELDVAETGTVIYVRKGSTSQ